MNRGKFITLEGGEGAGKSTQAALLVEALGKAGRVAIRTREPGGSPGAEDIRRLLVEGEPGRWDGQTEALLMIAARRSHLTETIWPALDRGDWVVSDRFCDSTLAYQGYGRGLDREGLKTLHRWIAGDFAPDLTLIFDLPTKTGLGRATKRGAAEDHFEHMDLAFHERLRLGFLEIAAAEPQRCVVIDAAPDAATVHQAVLAALRQRLG